MDGKLLMAGIEVRVQGYGDHAFNRAYREFEKLVSNSGILQEVRRRRYYRPPSVIRKQKRATKREKSRKNGMESRR